MKIAQKLMLAAAVAVFAAGGLMAQETGLKIGFVNLEILFVESPQGRVANDDLSEMFAPRQREIGSKQTRLQELEELFERDAETMGAEQLREAEREGRELRRDIQQMAQAFEEDLRLERQNNQSELGSIFLSHITQVAEENGYDLVLTTGVVYFSDAVNITPQVLGALQESSISEQQD